MFRKLYITLELVLVRLTFSAPLIWIKVLKKNISKHALKYIFWITIYNEIVPRKYILFDSRTDLSTN